MNKSWVYILECSDKSYYTGSTTDLATRIEQHNAGMFQGYTAFRRPVKLIWHQEFSDIRYAIEAERKIKGWTRAKKEALMRGDFHALHELSISSETKKRINH
jgi:predicted GIY-YIG superfamily endonuclease